MTSQTPRISVIIPVYNAETWLPRCLDSVINQSFRDIEILCVNDGSTDHSAQILREYAAKDSRIIVLEQENSGAGAARNRGILAARGEFISFVDSDDKLLPDAYARLMRVMTDGVDAVCFGTIELRDDREVNSGYFRIPFEGSKTMTDDELLHLSRTVWNKLFRLDIVLADKVLFPERCSFDDNAFTLNYFIRHRNLFFLPDKFYVYYRRKGSLTANAEHHAGGAFEYFKALDAVHAYWGDRHIISQHFPLFERLCVKFFRDSLNISLPFERSGIVWEMSRRLQAWKLPLEDNVLQDMRDGACHIYLGKMYHRRNILNLKPLKGLQKILFIGNSGRDGVLRLFGQEILRWKKN